MNKFKILYQAIVGNLYKIRVWFHIWMNIRPKCSEQIAENVIVSLTSYGRRVSKCAPYAVFSIFVQSMRPEEITLWLDKEKWSNENLPFALKRMQQWGMVNVEYCRDIRSYTKLIPALKKYPDKAIVTVDDDIYYSRNLVLSLYRGYYLHPTSVIAQLLCRGRYVYNNKSYKFPLGTGGVLYPPHALSTHVLEEDLFMTLCPSLDDLWFYVMTLLNKTNIACMKEAKVFYYYVDLFYQREHRGSRLYDIVISENDETLWRLLQYFNLEK